MPVSRALFQVNKGAGRTWQDTGPAMEGALMDVVWVPGTGDTGGAITIEGKNHNDTGTLFTVAVDDNTLGGKFVKTYKHQTYDTGGAISSEEFFFLAGEELRVKVQNDTGVALTGDLYIKTGP